MNTKNKWTAILASGALALGLGLAVAPAISPNVPVSSAQAAAPANYAAGWGAYRPGYGITPTNGRTIKCTSNACQSYVGQYFFEYKVVITQGVDYELKRQVTYV